MKSNTGETIAELRFSHLLGLCARNRDAEHHLSFPGSNRQRPRRASRSTSGLGALSRPIRGVIRALRIWNFGVAAGSKNWSMAVRAERGRLRTSLLPVRRSNMPNPENVSSYHDAADRGSPGRMDATWAVLAFESSACQPRAAFDWP